MKKTVEKTKRLNEVNKELEINDKEESEILDDEQEEQEEEKTDNKEYEYDYDKDDDDFR